MRYLIILFTVLLGAVGLSAVLSHFNNAGYVLIAVGHWQIESTFWSAFFLVLLGFVVFYFFIRIIILLFTLSERFSHWKKLRDLRRTRQFNAFGYCELAKGNWLKAETSLNKAAKISKGWVSLMGAAKAAQALKAFQRRDDYLRTALLSIKGTDIAVGLLQAKMQIDSEQWEQALANLQRVNQLLPNQSYALSLLKDIYIKLEDYAQLKNLLPKLKKNKLLTASEENDLEQNVYLYVLNKAKSKGFLAAKEAWKQLPKFWQQNNRLRQNYISFLVEKGEYQDAISIIEQTLKKGWDKRLVQYYMEIPHPLMDVALKKSENWLEKYPNEPTLLLCVGLFCMQSKLWGKAKDYFTQSVRLSPSPQSYLALGDFYESQGEMEKARVFYREGLIIQKTNITGC